MVCGAGHADRPVGKRPVILLRRMRPAAAEPVVLTGLVMVVILSFLALSPWPRWTISRSGKTAQSAVASANMSFAASR